MRTAGKAGGSAPDAMTWLKAKSYHVARVEIVHHAGAHMGGADRKPQAALVEQREVDQLLERRAKWLGRVIAGMIGAEMNMGAPRNARVCGSKNPEMPLVSVIHDASASPGPAQAGNA